MYARKLANLASRYLVRLIGSESLMLSNFEQDFFERIAPKPRIGVCETLAPSCLRRARRHWYVNDGVQNHARQPADVGRHDERSLRLAAVIERGCQRCRRVCTGENRRACTARRGDR